MNNLEILNRCELGRRIAQARKDAGMTQKDLSLGTLVNPSTINRYERGDIARPKESVMTAIAEATNTDVNWLLYGTDKDAASFQKSEDKEKLVFRAKRFSESRNVRVSLEA